MKETMSAFERQFAELLSGSVLPMNEVLGHVGAVAGKRLRPRLVYLSARLFGEVTEATHRTALFVELLHTATLIHDDVVDESDVRRGQASVNARFGNKTAVLVGDYLLSKAMMLLSNPEDHLILKEMLGVAMAMSEGELLQNGRQKTGDGRQKAEDLYLDIIERKTARLICACCLGGALSADAQLSTVNYQLLSAFGLNLGLIFQMRDDILDHDDPETTALAEKLLPEYLEKTLQCLDALGLIAKHPETLSSFRELVTLSAERTF